jgi:Sigma-54 interaction domain
MEDRFGAIAASDRETAPRLIQAAADVRLARTAAEEFFQMGTPRVNVLLVGRDDIVQLVLRTLLVHVRKPIVRWSPGDELVLPANDRPGTLVLHDVGLLSIREQLQVLEWSARARGTIQTISTTSAPLLPRVAAGHFEESLYYRLNTVYLDVARFADAA